MYPSVCVECIVVEAVMNASWFFPWMHLETTVRVHAGEAGRAKVIGYAYFNIFFFVKCATPVNPRCACPY
uniref:Uncharacterized protein n=1 Tax=Brassica campestris TaxID=3711 RepID=A0A3P5Z565_BRACM|nr:unnamed protein product [Brassica rapa]